MKKMKKKRKMNPGSCKQTKPKGAGDCVGESSPSPFNAPQATPSPCLEETVSVAEVGLEDECRERVVDLSTCQNVMFEARKSVPGVKFEEEGRDGWVEVVRKRRKRMKKVTGVEDLGSSSESELDVVREPEA